jgi:uncharacterized protein (TIGR03435 family)
MVRHYLTMALTLCGAVLVPATLVAQIPLPEGPPVDPGLRFEVASIKPYVDSGPTRLRMQPSGQFDMTAAAVRLMLRNAFRVQDHHLIGVPDWANTDRYSVVAKAPSGAPVTAMPTMLKNLMVDRFNLAFHRETREVETFDLMLDNGDAKLGPALRPTSAECEARITSGAPAAAAPPPVGDQAPCGAMQTAAGIVRASGVPLGRLVQMLTQFTNRPVSDKTGLTGLYDFTLKFNPNLNADAAVDADAPHLFTALRDQLRLRLVSQRGPAAVVVIDRIEKPTPD